MPDPGSVYSDKNVRASNSLLRTFMLRLTGALQALFGPNGYPVVFNATYLSNAVQLQSGSTSRIEALVSGVYNFQYTGQVLSSSANSKEIAIWIRRDGTDINYSTRVFTDSDNNHRNTTSWSFNIDLRAGQYVEIIAAVTSTDIWLDAAAAASPRTAVPSSVMSVNFISPLPQEMPTPP